jgi:hypothetical protein
MPMTWTIQDGLVVIGVVGTHDLREFKKTISAAVDSPGFRPGMPLFIDARSSYSYLSTKAIEERLEFVASLREKGVARRCAAVTTPQRMDVSLLASVMLEKYGMQLGVFLDLDEARTWLGAGASEHSNLA